jgi:hypothetical protein
MDARVAASVHLEGKPYIYVNKVTPIGKTNATSRLYLRAKIRDV